MIDARVGNISKLAGDLAVMLLAPIIFLCLGFANSRLPFNRHDREFRMRLVLALSVLFFVFAICTVMVQDRAILIYLWQESPILYSLVYLVGGIFSVVGTGALIYFKLRPELWRRNRHE
jgi:hypothetical protein